MRWRTLAAIVERDGWRCWLCRRRLDAQTATLDHYVPRSVWLRYRDFYPPGTGVNNPCNLRVACGPCNHKRSNDVPKDVLAHHDKTRKFVR